jgi:recombination protein RecT
MSTDLVQVIEGQRNEFQRVVCDQSINFDREAGFALQILRNNDYTGKIALSNPDSVRAAVSNVAAIGISLNPASKLAYLVPRKGSVCLDISYMGMMHLAQISGAIQWGQAAIVRANDVFELNGVDKQPTHKFNPFSDVSVRGPIAGCYVVVKTDSGDFLTHTMTAEQINSIRDRSEAWKAKQSGPWATDYEEMAKKTVVKQAAKYWPRRERVDTAIHYMNTEGGEGINFADERITPLAGVRASQPTERQKMLADLGIHICDELANGNEIAALNAYRTGLGIPDYDNEAIAALWTFLDSETRARIKKLAAANPVAEASCSTD